MYKLMDSNHRLSLYKSEALPLGQACVVLSRRVELRILTAHVSKTCMYTIPSGKHCTLRRTRIFRISLLRRTCLPLHHKSIVDHKRIELLLTDCKSIVLTIITNSPGDNEGNQTLDLSVDSRLLCHSATLPLWRERDLHSRLSDYEPPVLTATLSRHCTDKGSRTLMYYYVCS